MKRRLDHNTTVNATNNAEVDAVSVALTASATADGHASVCVDSGDTYERPVRGGWMRVNAVTTTVHVTAADASTVHASVAESSAVSAVCVSVNPLAGPRARVDVQYKTEVRSRVSPAPSGCVRFARCVAI